MPTYYFHCTDGSDLVLDRHGCDVEDEDESAPPDWPDE